MAESGIGDFFRQLPIQLIVMFCGSCVLLLFAIGYFVFARIRRSQAEQPIGGKHTMSMVPPSSQDDMDMPDLDFLTSNPLRTSASGTYRLQLADGSLTEAAEIMVVLRDVVEGGLIVQIGAQAYRVPIQNGDSEFKRRLNHLIREIVQDGVNMGETNPPADQTPSPSPVSSTLSQPTEGKTTLPGDLPKFEMPGVSGIPMPTRFGRRPKLEKTVIPEINIVAAIEAFLQHKLSTTGAYAGRSIHVREAPGGGVTIEVDGQFYDSVDAVTDPEIRDYINATIQEWQDRQ